MEEPLIYTVKGNLPIAELEYRTKWELSDDFIKFSECYLHQGEIVKESAHVFDKNGVFAQSEIAN